MEVDHNTAIYILELRTHDISTVPGSEGLYSPNWSPDGNIIVAKTSYDHKLVVYGCAARRWSDRGEIV